MLWLRSRRPVWAQKSNFSPRGLAEECVSLPFDWVLTKKRGDNAYGIILSKWHRTERPKFDRKDRGLDIDQMTASLD
jgi:hypothetical protein